MSLVPWKNKDKRVSGAQSEYAPVMSLRNEIDHIFDQFLSHTWGGTTGFDSFGRDLTGNQWAPSLDVRENEKEVKILMDAPGMDPKEINLSLQGSVLTVSGEKKEEKEEKEGNYIRTERSFGSFRRAVELPSSIDPESVEAEYKNGVLSVTIAKAVGAEPRKIPITGARG